jgi:hypothetical protein
MAAIRLPASASELLPFCSRHPDPHKQTCFETYAHLLVTAAAVGFSHGGNSRSLACRSFINQPGPIDLAIFRSQGLMPQMLILGMSCFPHADLASDENELAKLIEDLAEVGLAEMERLLLRDGQSLFPWQLAQWIVNASSHRGPSL